MRKYFQDIWEAIRTVLAGMRITIHYALSPSEEITMQYPEQKEDPVRGWKIPDRYRGLIVNDIEKCTVCTVCARTCPIDCIVIEAEGKGKQKVAVRFNFDVSRCMFCGLCVEACPTGSLKVTKEYELSTYTRGAMIYHYGLRP